MDKYKRLAAHGPIPLLEKCAMKVRSMEHLVIVMLPVAVHEDDWKDAVMQYYNLREHFITEILTM